jgi:hypothetical protein
LDVNIVFELPAEFQALEAEVVEMVLGAKLASFEKPKKTREAHETIVCLRVYKREAAADDHGRWGSWCERDAGQHL